MLRPPRAHRATLGALLGATCLSLAACGSNSSSASSSASTATSSAASSAAGAGYPSGCHPVPAPAPRPTAQAPRPTLRLSASASHTVRMLTNCGEIDIALDVRHAPRTTASFASLARRGFYDGVTFHRIVPGFVIQGGDPAGNGSGGPGYQVVEAPPAGLRYTPGVVAMAKLATDPSGASGSQFFIVTGPQGASLPPQYALVGRVVQGQSVADRIAAIPADPTSGAPTVPVVMSRVTVSGG